MGLGIDSGLHDPQSSTCCPAEFMIIINELISMTIMDYYSMMILCTYYFQWLNSYSHEVPSYCDLSTYMAY